MHALLDYATFLNDNFDLKVPGEGGARLLFQILEGCVTNHTIADGLFGPPSVARQPYSSLVAAWQRRKMALLPMTRLFVYPLALVGKVLAAPFMVPKVVYRACAGRRKGRVDTLIKPPIADVV